MPLSPSPPLPLIPSLPSDFHIWCGLGGACIILINMEDNYGSDDEGMENFENEAEEGFSDDSEGSQDYTSEQPEGVGAGSEEEQEEEE